MASYVEQLDVIAAWFDCDTVIATFVEEVAKNDVVGV